MSYKLEEVGPLQQKALVSIPSEDFEKETNRVLRDLSKRVRVDGFRRGKIPMKVMHQRYGASVRPDVVNNLVNKHMKQILDENPGVIHMSEPAFAEGWQLKSDIEFSFDLEFKPELDPVGYLGLEVERPMMEIEEEDLEGALEAVRRDYATHEPIEDRDIIEEGDAVTMDVSFTLEEGEEPVTDEDVTLVVGDGHLRPEIEEALKGKAFDAEFDLTLPREDGSGDVTLSLSIKSVKRRVLPALDDDLARDTGQAETLGELKAQLVERMETMRDRAMRKVVADRIIDKLLEAHPMELPPAYLKEQVQNAMQAEIQRMSSQGDRFDATEFQQMMETMDRTVERTLKSDFVLQAIGEKEGLTLDQDTYFEFLKFWAEDNNADLGQIMGLLRQNQNFARQMSNSAFRMKVIDHLAAEATFKDLTHEEFQALFAEEEATQEKPDEPTSDKPKSDKPKGKAKAKPSEKKAPASKSAGKKTTGAKKDPAEEPKKPAAKKADSKKSTGAKAAADAPAEKKAAKKSTTKSTTTKKAASSKAASSKEPAAKKEAETKPAAKAKKTTKKSGVKKAGTETNEKG